MLRTMHRQAFLPAVTRAVMALADRRRSGMTTLYQPRIRQVDYAAFRRLLGSELPATYGTWLHVRREQGMQMVSQGCAVEDMEVSPDAFRDLCAARGERPTLQALWQFTQETARTRSDC
jgi:hypothetical protein